MKLVRRNTFETNSSSTHSITMCDKSDYDKWKNGELYYCEEDGKFYNEEERKLEIKKYIIYDKAVYKDGNYTYKGVTVKSEDIEKLYTEENLKDITEEDVDDYMEDGAYYDIPLTYEEWDGYYDYEKYEESYTTKGGEKIIGFGYYGNDY